MSVAASPAASHSALHREETPLPGHAAEVVGATIHEAQARAGDQILHGAGDEDLAGRGARRHPSPDVDGNAPHIVAHQLALARVQPGPDLDPERADAFANGAGAADRARRSVKRREEAVAYRLHFATAEPP